MTSAWMVVAVLAAIAMQAPASEPAAIQDPPGEVDTWQPAGVTVTERNADATGSAESTSLGTDTGHGTGTEAAAPPARVERPASIAADR